jgi:uncharacterized protein with GYD domain
MRAGRGSSRPAADGHANRPPFSPRRIQVNSGAAAAFPGRCAVPTYVLLANWTEQGIRGVKESPRRLDTAKKALKDMGGEFKSVFLTLGDYDLVVIYEAPDDAVAARFNLQLGMLGNIRTRTMKAFPEAAYREIITSLG